MSEEQKNDEELSRDLDGQEDVTTSEVTEPVEQETFAEVREEPPEVPTVKSAQEGDGSDVAPVKAPKRKKQVSLSAFLITVIALVLAAVMVTYACCANLYKQKIAESQLAQIKYYPFELFDAFLETFALEDLDEDAMMQAALKAYIAGTGDQYAAYYTAEEYKIMTGTNAGDSEGIGINVINHTVSVEGVSYDVFLVINVSKNSPAEKVGVKVGDMVYAVGLGTNAQTVTELGYDVAIAKLQGAAGTDAQFGVFRLNGDTYETKEFTVTRAKVTTTSVYYHPSVQNKKVGIIKIVQFDLTTPKQFSEAMDSLIKQGCERFVFDVRYNPGGDLRSIEAVLSYFLEEEDVIIRTVNAEGASEISYVKEISYGGAYADCSVSEADIGKYRGVEAVVLCNESTASAAELFAATFRDYQLGTLVGTTTFGKGSMQSIFSLEPYGYSGALKMTTAMYYPAKGDNYHGVGIVPHVSVELSEEAAKKNIYLLTDEEDNQLQKALEQFGVQK